MQWGESGVLVRMEDCEGWEAGFPRKSVQNKSPHTNVAPTLVAFVGGSSLSFGPLFSPIVGFVCYHSPLSSRFGFTPRWLLQKRDREREP